MRKTTLIKVIPPVLTALVFPFFINAQCLGPTATGFYVNGKQPTANGKFFINHVFSTFTTVNAGSVNGNTFISTKTGGTGTYALSTTNPSSAPVAGNLYPATSPQQQAVAPAIATTSVIHVFTSPLATGTHLWIQDCDINEGWTITFRDATNAIIDPGNFTLFNVSATTASLPAFTKTATDISVRGVTTNVAEPLVGIIISSPSVTNITFAVTNSTGLSTTQVTRFFYSVPLTPSFTATASSNSTICSGNTLSLAATPGALASTIPTPLTYAWSGPNSFTSATQNPSISPATTAAAGTYNVTVQDAFGCTPVIASTAVAINQTPIVSLSGNTPVNYGSNINLTASITGGSSPYTIGWTGPNSFTSAIQNPTINTVTSANGGVYTFTVSDNNNCSIVTTTYVAVKSGWIYIHNKCINEESSTNFNYTLKDNSNNILKTFTTNDSAGNALNMYDLGAGHDDAAGELWAAAAGVAAGTTGTGTAYRRQQGSNLWEPTAVTTATAIDGAGLNQFFYISAGDAYYYNAGTSTLIFNHLTPHNGQTVVANDVAYGGGKIAVRNSGGKVYLYTGNLTNDSWMDISANTNIADRIDISSDGSMIVYIKGAVVYAYSITTGIITTYPAFTATPGAGQSGTRDIAIDDNGTIYATGNTGNTTCCGNTEIVYSYPNGATAWTAEPEARGVKRLTAGAGGQAWGGVNLGNFNQSIYARVTDNIGTHLWLDDERIKNSGTLYSNSIMMEVPSGIYKVVETLPDATWDLGRYNIYDPTGNTTGNVLNNTSTIRPANGEVVHVEYINEKLNPKLIDNGNCNTSILQSFDAGPGLTQFGSGTFGTPLEGTAYHYFNLTSPQDGYYSIVNTTDGNWFSTPGVTDHTGNGGYFLLVNASYAKDEFYRQRITGLTQNLTYRIEFYVSNIAAANPIRPKIRFGMQTLDGTIFGDSTTPEILTSTWQRYSISFTVPPGVTTADLFIRNENIGGSGNDLTIDDIAINPIPTPLVTNVISPAVLSNLCVGSSYTISNSVSGGKWSISNPAIATVDTLSGVITINDTGAAKITYTYINNIYCVSTSSNDVTISVPPVVQVAATSSDVCKNVTTTLNASSSSGTAPYSYLWSGSNGTIVSPASASSLLIPPTEAGSYIYTIKVTDSVGCVSPLTSTTVAVHAPVASINPLCVVSGTSPFAQLMESGGTSGVSWLWTTITPDALFYESSAYINGTLTSALQFPYINHGGNYKVLITDPYTCQDSSSFVYDHSSCTILPVSLISFSATPKGDIAVLNWATSSETNTKYFAIERSTDKLIWKQIGTTPAAGFSAIEKYYSFTDVAPRSGFNYYRLKQADADGRNTISYVRFVQMSDNWRLQIYPNPVTNNALQLQSNKRMSAITITDINGKLLMQAAPSTEVYQINISNFAAGFYVMQVTNEAGEIHHTRFIKK